MNQALSYSKEESEISSSSTSSNPNEEGVNRSNPIEVEVEVSKAKNANVVKSKDSQIRDAIKWKFKEAKDKYLDGLEPTVTRLIAEDN